VDAFCVGHHCFRGRFSSPDSAAVFWIHLSFIFCTTPIPIQGGVRCLRLRHETGSKESLHVCNSSSSSRAVQHFCKTFLCIILVQHFCASRQQLRAASLRSILARRLYIASLCNTRVQHSCATLVVQHSCATLVCNTRVQHSCATTLKAYVFKFHVLLDYTVSAQHLQYLVCSTSCVTCLWGTFLCNMSCVFCCAAFRSIDHLKSGSYIQSLIDRQWNTAQQLVKYGT